MDNKAQEPVAWIEYLWVENEDDGKLYPETRLYDYPSDDAQPLYTHPAPSREPLSDDELHRCVDETFGAPRNPAIYSSYRRLCRAIEKAHGIGV